MLDNGLLDCPEILGDTTFTVARVTRSRKAFQRRYLPNYSALSRPLREAGEAAARADLSATDFRVE
ncbi:hypothetical protein J6590_078221 [Homalodisca vitripennis]|nr:hypothetical protein J6590_078221 [Homalodisca vitripennis]